MKDEAHGDNYPKFDCGRCVHQKAQESDLKPSTIRLLWILKKWRAAGKKVWRGVRVMMIYLLLVTPAYGETHGLLPEVVQKLQKLEVMAAKEQIFFKVTQGYKSPAEQAKLYARGRTTPGRIVTKTLKSRHISRKAFDIVVLVPKDGFQYENMIATWKKEDYYRIGELGKSIGLTWGGDWKMRDYCHFELRGE